MKSEPPTPTRAPDNQSRQMKPQPPYIRNTHLLNGWSLGRGLLLHRWTYTFGGTQTGSYQTGSYQKGRFVPPKTKSLYVLFVDTTPFICLWHVPKTADLVQRTAASGCRHAGNWIAIITINRMATITINRIATITIRIAPPPGLWASGGASRFRWRCGLSVTVGLFYIYIYIYIYVYGRAGARSATYMMCCAAWGFWRPSGA